jgi:hypothetical protein
MADMVSSKYRTRIKKMVSPGAEVLPPLHDSKTMNEGSTQLQIRKMDNEQGGVLARADAMEANHRTTPKPKKGRDGGARGY